jgi:histone H1/5
LTRHTGTSGPVKLAKKEAKPAAATATKKAEPKAEKKTVEKKTAEKKTSEKKVPATKKATTTVCVSSTSPRVHTLTHTAEDQGHYHKGCAQEDRNSRPSQEDNHKNNHHRCCTCC